MKITTYNINGIRASFARGLKNWLLDFNSDIYCFQEVRADEITTKKLLNDDNQQNLFESNLFEQYYKIYNCSNKAGYAGTLILSKIKPDIIKKDMKPYWTDEEGRTTTLIFKNLNLAVVNSYIPNGNSRLEFKMNYLSALTKYLKDLSVEMNVICVGDFNIAHKEIDLTNPVQCKNKSVFLPQERKAFSDILELDYIDCFRQINPDKVEYSWRSYSAMQSNNLVNTRNFWKYRIDYILFHYKNNLKLKDCKMIDLPYSDHLPVIAEFEI